MPASFSQFILILASSSQLFAADDGISSSDTFKLALLAPYLHPSRSAGQKSAYITVYIVHRCVPMNQVRNNLLDIADALV